MDFQIDFGWDPTNRFYVISTYGSQRLTVVDGANHQSCSIEPESGWRSGHWILENEQTVAYQIYDSNQYGLNVGKRLDLATWELTVTTAGVCLMSPDDCASVDPPSVSTTLCTSS